MMIMQALINNRRTALKTFGVAYMGLSSPDSSIKVSFPGEALAERSFLLYKNTDKNFAIY
jgi:hypothetical protein